jgi:hypothetical protein
MIVPSRGINNIRAWKILFLDAAQRMSQFIEGIAAPTYGDSGDGDEIGAALSMGTQLRFYSPLISAQITIVHYSAIS